MIERYAFPVRYDEKLIRTAVNGFVARALFRETPLKTYLPLALILLACGGLLFMGETETAIEIFVALAVVLAIFVAMGWRMHLRAMREKLAAMKGRWPMAHLYDEGVVIDGPGPASMLEWPAIKAIWRLEGVWLLILATNHFVALPLAGAPGEALDFLDARVAAAQKLPPPSPGPG